MNNNSLCDRYAPTSLGEIAGHPSAIKKIKKWADKWKSGDAQEPLLLFGPPGTGKTSTAECLANDYGWSLVEINASSSRTKDDIISLAQQMRTESIGGQKQLFLLDEVDSIDGRSLKPLLNVLDNRPNPVICTANEKWKVPDSIENRCTNHKFNLQNRSIKPVVREIAEEEGIDISSRQLGQLATRNGLRDAINDLQSYAESNGDTDWDQRETEDSPFAVTERILRNKDYIGGEGMTPPDMVDFLTENLPGEFEGVEYMRAMQALSEADKFIETVNSSQDYSWWRYAGSLAEDVSNLRVTEPYDGYMNISYPQSRRNRTPKPTAKNSTAKLYRQIKSQNTPEYSYSFNFQEFRNEILPMLKNMTKEEKKELIFEESLDSDAYTELGITKTEYEEWAMSEVEEETTLDDFSEKESEEETGLMDF